MDLLFVEEHQKIQNISERLQQDANALAVLVINKEGQEMARAGQTTELDITSLSSLFAGNIAATNEIARLLKEEEFGGQFHEGSKYSVHLSVVARKAILVVLFDGRSSLGLVRLRVRKATEEMTRVFEQAGLRAQSTPVVQTSGLWQGELTDADIDRLFGE